MRLSGLVSKQAHGSMVANDHPGCAPGDVRVSSDCRCTKPDAGGKGAWGGSLAVKTDQVIEPRPARAPVVRPRVGPGSVSRAPRCGSSGWFWRAPLGGAVGAVPRGPGREHRYDDSQRGAADSGAQAPRHVERGAVVIALRHEHPGRARSGKRDFARSTSTLPAALGHDDSVAATGTANGTSGSGSSSGTHPMSSAVAVVTSAPATSQFGRPCFATKIRQVYAVVPSRRGGYAERMG